QLVARPLRRRPLLGVERGFERRDPRMEGGRVFETDLDEGVTLAVDGLLRARELSVVGERRHYWPVKRGFLFSRNAFAPSMRSSGGASPDRSRVEGRPRGAGRVPSRPLPSRIA